MTDVYMLEPRLQVPSAEEEQRPPVSEDGVATLIVRHLPEAIPSETLSNLFSYYGAVSVRPCSPGRLRNCAFVDFKSQGLAYQAQRQLNGLKFLGKVLSVERVNKSYGDKKRNVDDERESNKISRRGTLEKDATASDKDSIDRLRSGKGLPSEPIAPRLGLDYPFPPHLEYAYPPPDSNILTNIVNALIAVPRFYTQVLHLMNKMNIPAPFRMALPTPPLPQSEQRLSQLQLNSSPAMAAEEAPKDFSSSETEMESSDEEKISSGITLKGEKSRRKRAKREAIVGPGVDKDVSLEAVGLKVGSLVPKEIPIIKKRNSVVQIKITPKVAPIQKLDESVAEKSEEPNLESSDGVAAPYAIPDEIRSKQLALEEILSLPKFKSYNVGEPTTVLYLKNLDKSVVSEDFFYIFGSLFGGLDAAKASLNIKLMHEGRMKGQAFVTFPTVEQAHQALVYKANMVNGFVFKGKPIIIQFGRYPSRANKTEVT